MKYFYCETIAAGGGSPWHIRPAGPRGIMLSGGADTKALCGRKVSWDLPTKIEQKSLQLACKDCAELFSKTGASHDK